MVINTPPRYIKEIIKKLQSRGYESYLVGQCVRDLLLGRSVNEWYICANATIDELTSLFDKTSCYLNEFEIVEIYYDNKITSIRPLKYTPSKSEDSQLKDFSFVSNLNKELQSNAFTTEAIAVNDNGEIVDTYYAYEDIQSRIIKCTKNPDLTFINSPEEMFRAFTHAARLSFTIDSSVYDSICNNSAEAKNVPIEYIRSKTERVLTSPHPDLMKDMIDTGILDIFLDNPSIVCPSLKLLNLLPNKSYYRWFGLCQILEKSGVLYDSNNLLHKLRINLHSLEICENASSIIKQIPNKRSIWKKYLKICGSESVLCAVTYLDCSTGSEYVKLVKSILNSKECFSEKYLSLTRNDLLYMGYEEKYLDEIMNFLLDYVIEYPQYNKASYLKALLQNDEDEEF